MSRRSPPVKSKLKQSAPTQPAAPPAKAPSRGVTSNARRVTRARVTRARPRPLAVRELLRGVPTAAWVCALVAFLNAACWSVISPPFQVPDEPSHFAYVQRLAETGSLPRGSGLMFPFAEEIALEDLRYPAVREHPSVPTISTASAQHKLEHDLALPYSRTNSDNAGVAASEPPLYYALETIPYELESSGTVLDRLALMRLLSALFGSATALFTFLFLREALPAERWAWTVGGLGVALAPLLGVMSGAVNPDALLFAISAALFYCLARGFRRGLTPRLALALGALLLAGCLTKLNFVGLLPGAIAGLLVLCLREARSSPRNALRCLGLACAVSVGPVALFVLLDSFAGRPSTGPVTAAFTLSGARGPILHELSYVWQFYLPRLPGMKGYFHGLPTTRTYWFDGLVGLYGWLDTTFPSWVYTAALVPFGAIVVLLARELFVSRATLRSRPLELLVYAAMGLGLLFIIGVDDYIHKNPGEYAEPRYLLPLLPLWGVSLALAARGAGRRWGPIAGVLIVGLVLAQDVFSQLLVISRYYV
jgi:Predicted membrane protein (DUF2142)